MAELRSPIEQARHNLRLLEVVFNIPDINQRIEYELAPNGLPEAKLVSAGEGIANELGRLSVIRYVSRRRHFTGPTGELMLRRNFPVWWVQPYSSEAIPTVLNTLLQLSQTFTEESKYVWNCRSLSENM